MHTKTLFMEDFLRLKWLSLIPLAILFVLLPISAWQQCEAFRLMGAKVLPIGNIMYDSQIYCSFFSLWWPFFILKEYVEGDGNELLFTARRARSLLPVTILSMVAYLSLVGLVMVGYSFFFGSMFWNFEMIMIQVMLYTGAFFFLSFLFRSTVFSVMFVFIYHAFAAYFLPSNMQYFSIFIKDFGEKPWNVVLNYWPLMAIGAALAFIGAAINGRYRGTLN